MAERTETLAAIRNRLLAAGPKRAKRTSGKPVQTQEQKASGMWKRAWSKINADTTDSDDAAAAANLTTARAKPTSDRVRAAFRRGLRQSTE